MNTVAGFLSRLCHSALLNMAVVDGVHYMSLLIIAHGLYDDIHLAQMCLALHLLQYIHTVMNIMSSVLVTSHICLI